MGALSHLHDGRIIGYDVRGEARRIVIYVRPEATDARLQLLTFEGVIAYRFDDVADVSILLDVEEIAPARFLAKEWPQISAGYHRSGAPGGPAPWGTSQEKVLAYLIEHATKAFVLEPTWGMSGWVLARSAVVTEAPANRDP